MIFGQYILDKKNGRSKQSCPGLLISTPSEPQIKSQVYAVNKWVIGKMCFVSQAAYNQTK